MLRFTIFLLFATMAVFSAAFSHEVRTGDIVISHPVIPAPVASQPVAAGYLQITNNGDKTERLVSVEAAFAGKAEVHTMKLVEGVMRMRPLKGGLDIAAGETVVLKQGGFHLMFMRLSARPEVGQFQKVLLKFARAGAVEVEMLVIDRADIDEEYKAGKQHSDHGSHSQDAPSGHSRSGQSIE